MAARGEMAPALMQPRGDTSRCCSGRAERDVPGPRQRARSPRGKGSLRYSSGPGRTAARGRRRLLGEGRGVVEVRNGRVCVISVSCMAAIV